MTNRSRSFGGAMMGAIAGGVIMYGISRMLDVSFADWMYRLFSFKFLDAWILMVAGGIVPIFIGIVLAKEGLPLWVVPILCFILSVIETVIVCWIVLVIVCFVDGDYIMGAVWLVGGGFIAYLLGLFGAGTTATIIEIYVITK